MRNDGFELIFVEIKESREQAFPYRQRKTQQKKAKMIQSFQSNRRTDTIIKNTDTNTGNRGSRSKNVKIKT
jgi:hypothetical protein